MHRWVVVTEEGEVVGHLAALPQFAPQYSPQFEQEGLSKKHLPAAPKKAVVDPAQGECRVCVEHVLEVYTRPYDLRYPQVCMDEVSKQLLRDYSPVPDDGARKAQTPRLRV
jgi:hypothetical protein